MGNRTWVIAAIVGGATVLIIATLVLTYLYTAPHPGRHNSVTSLSDYQIGPNKRYPAKVVVSTTTIPGRLEYISHIVNNMYTQSYRPDKLYLNIPRECRRLQSMYSDEEVARIDTKGGWVEVVRCKDYGPATKLLGSIDKITDPETIVITVDDDQDYTSGLIYMLVSHAQRLKDAVVCTQAATIHMRATSCTGRTNDTAEVMYAEGFGGIAYRRKFITPQWFDMYSNISSECWLSDDLVFSTLLAEQGVKRVRICCDKDPRADVGEIDHVDALKELSRWETYEKCKNKLLKKSKIPDVVNFNFFGWEGEMPDVFIKCHDLMRRVNTGFDVVVHDAQTVERLVDEYSPELRKVYDAVPRRVMKSDIGRLLILLRYGGYYMDLDVDARSPLNHLKTMYPNRSIYLFTEASMGGDTTNTRIANHAMAMEPQSQFTHLCIQMIIDRLGEDAPPFPVASDDYVIWATGPDVVSSACHLVKPEHTTMAKSTTRYDDILKKIDPNSIEVLEWDVCNGLINHKAVGSWR